jgi:hypothetical protein
MAQRTAAVSPIYRFTAVQLTPALRKICASYINHVAVPLPDTGHKKGNVVVTVTPNFKSDLHANEDLRLASSTHG